MRTALIFTTYHLRRVMSPLVIKELLKRQKGLSFLFLMPHSTENTSSYQDELWARIAAYGIFR